MGSDEASDDPPWDPRVDLLAHPGCVKGEGEPSSDIEKFGDIMPRIRLSETCRRRWWWWFGDGRGHRDGVRVESGGRWPWVEDRGDADKDEVE